MSANTTFAQWLRGTGHAHGLTARALIRLWKATR